MKKLIAVAVIGICAAGIVPAQDLTVSGEIKTGFFWYVQQHGNQEPDSGLFVHNSEDSGVEAGEWGKYQTIPGRFRLNFQVESGNIGTKFRFETTRWPTVSAPVVNEPPVFWGYAFAYGYFWDKQIKISGGKMGDSPWSSGGPEMWRELDTSIGMRFELIPSFIPFIKPGNLNLGFVLNDMNEGNDTVSQDGYADSSLADILQESVLGLAYTNDYFHLRFAYRFDSIADNDIGDQMLYRIEERAIKKYLPGFQIFANGYFFGINGKVYDQNTAGPKPMNENFQTKNWLYVQYEPEDFTAQLRFGFDTKGSTEEIAFSIFYARASFFYKFFNNLLSPGIAFEYALDSGPDRKSHEGGYLRWYLEPQIRLNFANNTYVALLYRYQDDYHEWNVSNTATINSKTHWINLRAVLTF